MDSESEETTMKHGATCLCIPLVLLAGPTLLTLLADAARHPVSAARADGAAAICGGDFTLASDTPTGVHLPDAAWGDYDDDGDLDILLSGVAGITGPYTTEVWRNDGGGSFALASSAPTGIIESSVAWGDYDDDLDILLSGHTGSGPVTEVWRNAGGDSFTPVGATLAGVYYGSAAWGDYDNDGDLDILLAGNSGSGLVTEIWRSGPVLAHLPLALKASIISTG
jgi:hypothetical protein